MHDVVSFLGIKCIIGMLQMLCLSPFVSGIQIRKDYCCKKRLMRDYMISITYGYLIKM